MLSLVSTCFFFFFFFFFFFLNYENQSAAGNVIQINKEINLKYFKEILKMKLRNPVLIGWIS